MTHFTLLLVGLSALSATDAAPAAAWGAMGHRIVAQIAWDQLTPAARKAVTDLLEGEPLAEAATWADRIRSERRETGPLHYVNVPAGSAAWDSVRWCKDGACVVGAVNRYRDILADRNRPKADRAEALRFLIHFVGDMHQPLHVGDRGDRGGNDVKVLWRGKETNLHAVWDTDLLVAWAPSEGSYLRTLRRGVQRMRPETRRAAESGSVEGWAMDGTALAAQVVYQAVPGTDPGPAYLRAAGPVLDLTLTRAGLRLAALLNAALDPG